MNLQKRLIAATVIASALVGCSKVEYSPKELGFSDKTEMDAAFAKGYHTKQKLLEMTSLAKAASAPLPNPAQSIPIKEKTDDSATEEKKSTQMHDEQSQQTAESPKTNKNNPETCADVKACVDAMLTSAKNEDLSAAMAAARRIDGFDKPPRGDRKLARKLNDEGLAALKQDKNLDAIKLLTQAHEADKLDEEILSNLIYLYSEDGNYRKAAALSEQAFILNPRRSSLWIIYATTSAKTGNQAIGFESMWLAWQFSGNKEKMLATIDKKILDEKDASLNEFYTASREWLMNNKKPNF